MTESSHSCFLHSLDFNDNNARSLSFRVVILQELVNIFEPFYVNLEEIIDLFDEVFIDEAFSTTLAEKILEQGEIFEIMLFDSTANCFNENEIWWSGS